jgi:hypothetical protein
MTTTDELIDRIDRQIDIDASAERVYALVARPGWWINDGEVDPEQVTRQEDGLTVVVHPTYGEFRLRTLLEEPPRHVSFRWIDNVAPQSGTTVEFWIEDRADGGVTLKVSERGFTGLEKGRDEIAHQVEENSQGWTTELAAAKRYVETSAA